MSFRRRPHRPESEAGFTILESVVALVIIFGVLLVLLRSLDTGVRVVVESKRQAAASAFASELLERARSLEWENIGLTAESNDADCPAAASVDGVACSEWAPEFGVTVDGDGDYTFEGEKILFLNPAATFDPFLSFHDQTTRDDSVFDRYIFVTQQTDASGSEKFRKITAIVQWTPPDGFRREVRHVTFASAFLEPTQPVMTADIIFRGGNYEIAGMVEGTADWMQSLNIRPNLVSGTSVVLPSAEVSATSDYVSNASNTVRGTVSEFTWFDGFYQAGGGDSLEKRADDDFSSAAPLNDPLTVDQPLPRWQVYEAPVSIPWHDFIGTENADGASTEEYVTADAEALTSAGDELPYGYVAMRGAGTQAVGFREFVDGQPLADLYEATALGKGTSAQMVSAPYEFAFVNYGPENGDMLTYDGTVDRYETTVTARRIDASFAWDSQPVYLFADQVYDRHIGASKDFQGWIRIELPSISGSLSAGETAPPPSLSVGDVVISTWNTSTNSYQAVEAGVSPQSLSTQHAVTPINLTYSIPSTSKHPQLSYDVQATLFVNPTVGPNETYDGNGARAEVSLEVPPMVTGIVSYLVYDVIMDQVLYDLAIDLELGGVAANASYVNPEA